MLLRTVSSISYVLMCFSVHSEFVSDVTIADVNPCFMFIIKDKQDGIHKEIFAVDGCARCAVITFKRLCAG